MTRSKEIRNGWTDRVTSRAGTVPSEVVLGGRKVAIRRPRVRRDGTEAPLPNWIVFGLSDDPARDPGNG